jgi:hypothetical protein
VEGFERAKRPGGPLTGKPIQSLDKRWYDRFGEDIAGTLASDLELAAQYWNRNRPSGAREAMKENIEIAFAHGQLAIAVDQPSASNEDILKLAAYRVLARELGYDIGKFQFHQNSGTATAGVTKSKG